MIRANNLKQDKIYTSLAEHARNVAAADIFRIMSSEIESQALLNKIRSFSDQELKILGQVANIPEAQLDVYKDFVRGNDSELTQEFSKFDSKNMLHPGDIILMTGVSPQSKILAASQKPFYFKAISSHVAIVQSEFVCVDAIPKVGVSMRSVMDVLTNVQPNWRVIRFNGVNKTHYDNILKACAFYVMQPYQIKPKKNPGKNFSYCSELARKIFLDLKLKNTGIPNNTIVKPCNFDRLADQKNNWIDVTSEVHDFIVFCQKYEAIVKSICKLQIDGIKLNQTRYKERKELLRTYREKVNKGLLSKDKYEKIEQHIKEIESRMNFQFWNYQK